MSKNSNIFVKLRNIGVISELSPFERKSVVLVNTMTLCLFVLSIFAVVVALAWNLAKIEFVFALPFIWLVVLYLNHIKKYPIAASIFCFGGLLASAGLAIAFDHHQF